MTEKDVTKLVQKEISLVRPQSTKFSEKLTQLIGGKLQWDGYDKAVFIIKERDIVILEIHDETTMWSVNPEGFIDFVDFDA